MARADDKNANITVTNGHTNASKAYKRWLQASR